MGMQGHYPGGAAPRRPGLPGVVPLCLTFLPAFLLSGGLEGAAWFAGFGAACAVAGAAAAVSKEQRRGRLCDWLLIASVACLGIGWGSFRTPPAPVPMGVPELVVRGTIHEGGLGWEAREVSIARAGRWYPVSGRFLVLGDGLLEGLFIARGFIVSLDEPRLPGLADRSRGARWSLIRGKIDAARAWFVPNGGESPREGWRHRLRGALASRVGRSLPVEVRTIIPMLIWGERATVDPEIERIFRGTGTMHLLAISGLHVSLVAILLEFLLRLVLRRPIVRVLAVLGVLYGYGAMVGPMPSVVRSIVMAACILIARALGRSGGTAVAWWISLLVVGCFTPGEIPRAGMQLSFGGTAALILCPKTPKVIAPLFTSAVAVAVTSGVLWAHFGESAPMAIVANLTGIPAFAPVLVSVLWGLALGNPAGWTLQAIAWGPARLFSSAWIGPLAFLLPAGEAVIVRAGCGELVGLGSTVAILVVLALHRRFPSRRAIPVFAAAGALALSLSPVVVPLIRGQPRADLEAVILPVGQGDATLIRAEGGGVYLIDTGPGGMDGSRGRRALAPALRAHGALRLRGVFLTHGDEDHVGGLRGLLTAGIKVDTLYLSRGDGYRLLLPASRVPVVRMISAPWSLRDGPLTIDILAPRTEEQQNLGNAGSLVLRVRAAGGSLLLPGDLGGEEEERLAASGGLEPAQVLLAGHHGSGHSSGDLWCDRLRPRLALISCGARNRHGHPAPATLARFALRGIEVHRTDREGSLELRWVGGVMHLRRGGCGAWGGVL